MKTFVMNSNLNLSRAILSFCRTQFLSVSRRNKYKYKDNKDTHRSVVLKKKSTNKALEHFDDFYKSVYGKQWPSMRIALLTAHKYCAVVNNFGDTEATIANLENQGSINVKRLFEIEEEILKGTILKTSRKSRSNRILEKVEWVSSDAKELNSSRQLESEEEDRPEERSLAAELQHVQIDEQRVVDPAIGLDAAALHEFVPATRLKGMEDYVLESQHYGYYQQAGEFPVSVQQEDRLNFPEHLQVFSYERGNVTSFPSPKRSSTGVLNYFLFNGSSLLPVLALNLQPGDAVLDMCAGPGGKALLAVQTLYPGYLVCNDIKESRVKRIRSIFKQYLHDMKLWETRLLITNGDARAISENNLYDKIMVDVPCTTDRHSVMEQDNSIFKPARIKERLQLPELQSQLLSTALKLVKVGGCVVYSTCTLSPIQNDGVVHMALRTAWEESGVQVEVRNISSALLPARCIFNFATKAKLRYGQLVVPFLPSNFGPMYFCKIVRKA